MIGAPKYIINISITNYAPVPLNQYEEQQQKHKYRNLRHFRLRCCWFYYILLSFLQHIINVLAADFCADEKALLLLS